MTPRCPGVEPVLPRDPPRSPLWVAAIVTPRFESMDLPATAAEILALAAELQVLPGLVLQVHDKLARKAISRRAAEARRLANEAAAADASRRYGLA